MKKNDKVKWLSNPKEDDSKFLGVVTLLKFDNADVYLDGYHGYENWEAEVNGQIRNVIVHPRHLVKE